MPQVIAVRGWEKFQHYKDRDPPWVKLYRDLLTSESWVLGTDTSRLVQVASLLLAARYSNQTPLQWQLIRKVANLDCDERSFSEAVRHLASTNFLEIQSVTETGKAVVQDASTVLASCTSEAEAEAEAEQRQKRTSAAAPPDDADDFEELRAIYPKRSGDQRWHGARKAINARLAEGHSWPEILDGTKRYAEWCRVTGKLGTEHVKQAATFVGPEKGFLQPWTPPATRADARLSSNLDAAAEFMRRTEAVQ